MTDFNQKIGIFPSRWQTLDSLWWKGVLVTIIWCRTSVEPLYTCVRYRCIILSILPGLKISFLTNNKDQLRSSFKVSVWNYHLKVSRPRWEVIFFYFLNLKFTNKKLVKYKIFQISKKFFIFCFQNFISRGYFNEAGANSK